MKLVKGAETLEGGGGRRALRSFLKSVITTFTAAFCWQLLSFFYFYKVVRGRWWDVCCFLCPGTACFHV